MQKNSEHETKLRKGTAQHDAGLCFFLLVTLTDDCSPQGKRRRSELAEHLSAGTLRHDEVVLAV